MIHLLALRMDNRGRVLPQQDILTEVQLKNLDTGRKYKVDVEKGPQVISLPAGRYCVNWFRTYTNIKLEYCRPGQFGLPTVTVFPGLPTNAGRWILGIEYVGSSDRINYRVTHGVERDAVAAEALAKLGRPAALPPAVLPGSVWLSRDEFDVWTLMELGQDGVLYEHGGWNEDSQALGPWHLDGNRIKVEYANGYGSMDLEVMSSHIEGWTTTKDGGRSLQLWSPELLAPVPLNDTDQARVVFTQRPAMPDGSWPAFAGGEVRVSYHVPPPVMTLRGPQITVNPTQLRVVASTLPEPFGEAAIAAVQTYRFAPALRDGKPIESDGEVTVRFEPADAAEATPAGATSPPPAATQGPSLDAEGNRVAALAQRGPPRYPPAAVRRRLQGVVVARVEVRADGSVGDIVVLKSSGHEELDAAAMQSLRESRYHPAYDKGVPVDSRIEVPTSFSVK